MVHRGSMDGGVADWWGGADVVPYGGGTGRGEKLDAIRARLQGSDLPYKPRSFARRAVAAITPGKALVRVFPGPLDQAIARDSNEGVQGMAM